MRDDIKSRPAFRLRRIELHRVRLWQTRLALGFLPIGGLRRYHA